MVAEVLMPKVPNFVGPTYNLTGKPASVQRTINMVPVPLEAGNERVPWVFKDAPGLTSWSAGGAAIVATAWNSANEVVDGDWDFTEDDFLASVNYIIA